MVNMNPLINMIEANLKLTPDEKNKFEASFPAIKDVLDTIDAHMADIVSINTFYLASQDSLVTPLLNDWGIIGPNVSALLSNGTVDIGAVIGAVNDVEQMMALPAVVAQYNKLLPLIARIQADWPSLMEVLDIIDAALGRKGTSLSKVLEQARQQHKKASP
jgi:hypothetical protein